MKYLRSFNEVLNKDEVSECLIQLLDMGFDFRIEATNREYSKKITIKKFISDGPPRPKHTKHDYKTFITHQNLGCTRSLKAWDGDREIELDSNEKEVITTAIACAEKLMMSDDTIKEVKVESEYWDSVHPDTHNVGLVHCITLHVNR